MHIQQLSPYIRVAMDSKVPFPWQLEERVLYDYELLYVMEGQVSVTIEDQEYEGLPGDLFLFRPKQRHSIRKVGSGLLRQPHLHFDLIYQHDSPDVRVSFKPLAAIAEEEKRWFREDLLDSFSVPLSSHLRLRNPIVIEKMLLDIIKEHQMKLPFYEMNVKGMFIQLFIHLLRENYWNENPHVLTNMDELVKLRNYLKHQADQKVKLEQLVDFSGISKYYLIHLFKKTFGMSPIQYHQMLRIEKAKEMIQFTDEPLSLIAETVGYPDLQSFSKAFKKADGVSPSFYRKRNG
ncbi:AraC family transcriptional regulator [Paenibacillus beijingensis]|uniref:AraC family transcriptional regulator n=1 Tax=Paenibacillus beijingensis TaxID=1126833 RepID=A0A0D5NPT5_9BACL|nr:helix-turn-helix domain-containing protein [Paenibacillus beijingensis]AJY77319.1 AraC family transcriptional regulator [Paenibacillus beijingensis]